MYAEVAVNFPLPHKTFTYALPPDKSISPGQLVWVPFGSQTLEGMVFDLVPYTSINGIKEIKGVMVAEPLLLPAQLQLARWLSEYYMCPLYEASSLMLPPGIEQRAVTIFTPAPHAPPSPDRLTPPQVEILQYVMRKGPTTADEIRKAFPRSGTSTVINQLVKKGYLIKSLQVIEARARPKKIQYARLVVSREKAQEEIDHRRGLKKPSRLATVLEYLIANSGVAPRSRIREQVSGSSPPIKGLLEKGLIQEEGEYLRLMVDPVQAREVAQKMSAARGAQKEADLLAILLQAEDAVEVRGVLEEAGAGREAIEALARAGLISVESREVFRMPIDERAMPEPSRVTLNPMQARAWETVRTGLRDPDHSTMLLYGVTGSGKTEIYLLAVEETIAQGKQAIVLVPEIALTPQIIGWFASRFPGNVAVLHSKLSPGEHFDEWRRIKGGQVAVVIGSRSAVFAPFSNLGLIVVDEEHEWTYKQEQPPRYHARQVAIKLGEITGAKVILGSATPAIESYYHAQKRTYVLVQLPHRVGINGEGRIPFSPLPPIEVVDLRQELRGGNRSPFSGALRHAVTDTLDKREQVLLFLNRRGAASTVMCHECGYVLRCRKCDTALTYHLIEEGLVCHQCNYRTSLPGTCPQCRGKNIRLLGAGTQKVEAEARRLFPQARILRWDRDVTKGKHSHQELWKQFTEHQADILIGTQMIAKGFHVPMVTLVGVINADLGLYLPDFRAGERTFQLLTQVAGRAGRGARAGRVIIQTYNPSHYALITAAKYDYPSFYREEIRFRRQHDLPPFHPLARLVYSHTNALYCQKQALAMAKSLYSTVQSQGLTDISFIGPAPCHVSRLRGRYRWQLLLRGRQAHQLLASLSLPLGWALDIDPVSLL